MEAVLLKQAKEKFLRMRMNEENLFEEVSDTNTAYEKTIPNNSLSYCSVDAIGGKSVKWNQLVNDSSLLIDTETIGGVTKTYLNGFYKFNGVSTSASVFPLTGISSSKENCISGHKYFFSFYDANVGYVQVKYISTDSDFANTYDATIRGKVIVQATQNDKFRANFRTYNGETYDNLEVKYKAVDLTAIYGSGNEPTSVDDPRIAMIEAIAEQRPQYDEGSIIDAVTDEVVVRGKNLFPYSDLSTASAGYSLNKMLCQLKKGTYTLTATTESDVGESAFVFLQDNETVQTVTINNTWHPIGTREKRTFTLNKDTTKVSVYHNSASGYKDIQIEYGSTDTAYSPYRESVSYTIPQAIRNIEGYGWSVGSVYNEVDFENKKFIQRVGRVVFNNEIPQGFSVWGNASSSTLDSVTCAIIGFGTISKYAYNSRLGVTNRFQKVTTNVQSTTGLPNTWNFHIAASYSNYAYFKLTASELEISELDDNAITAAFKEWLKRNPLTVYYELAEPIITDITDILDSFEVEGGGSITFHQSDDSLHLPVPSKISYILKEEGT